MSARWGLDDWADIATRGDWPNLLVGNGLSISVSPVFEYDSLFDRAGFDDDDRALFEQLGTRNIELLLGHLQFTAKACEQSYPDAVPTIEARYGAVRQRLLDTIRRHHVENGKVPDERLRAIGRALSVHDAVWMTSYDLVPYWAAMSVGSSWFDGLWSAPGFRFDLGNAVRDRVERTYLWWPHGAVHLYEHPDGVAAKHTRDSQGGLLAVLEAQAADPETRPLIVSEGRSREKVQAIAGSDYLSHALAQLRASTGSIVIFGQALRAGNDDHLVDAIAQHPGRCIAYGVWATSQAGADEESGRVRGLFPDAEVVCFDSATHPLAG